jgi:hypothetical protein
LRAKECLPDSSQFRIEQLTLPGSLGCVREELLLNAPLIWDEQPLSFASVRPFS